MRRKLKRIMITNGVLDVEGPSPGKIWKPVFGMQQYVDNGNVNILKFTRGKLAYWVLWGVLGVSLSSYQAMILFDFLRQSIIRLTRTGSGIITFEALEHP